MNSSKVKVYAYPGMYSYWLEALMEWQGVDFEFIYTKKLPEDFGDISDAYDIILFNIPLVKRQKKLLEERFSDYLDTPFSDVYIVGSYVDPIMEELDVLVNIDNSLSPLSQFKELIEENKDQAQRVGIWFDDMDKEVIDTLNTWHTLEPINMAYTLRYLSDFWRDSLWRLPEIDTKDRFYKYSGNPMVKRMSESISEYVSDKTDEIRHYTRGGRSISFVYAEQYADYLSLDYLRNRENHVLLIGKHTKQDDLIFVRTSSDLDALEVAKGFRDEAKGDSKRAMFFLQNTPANIGKALSTYYFEK